MVGRITPTLGDKKPPSSAQYKPTDQAIRDWIKTHKGRNGRPLPNTKRSRARAIRILTKKNYEASLPSGREMSFAQTDAAFQVAYGFCRVPGVLSFIATTQNKDVMHHVYTIACHTITQVTSIIINDVTILFDGGGSYPATSTGGLDPAGNSVDGWAGKVYACVNYGYTTQPAIPELVAVYAGAPTELWTTDHRQRERAHVYLRLTYDKKLFGEGDLKVQFQILGKPLYDPRNDLTYGNGNPALMLADYITDSLFGLGYTWADIDTDSLSTAANVCDELVPTLTALELRYGPCGGSFTAETEPSEVIDTLERAMAGEVIYSGGKWKFQAGTGSRSTVLTLSEDDLRGPVTLDTITSKKDLINSVRGTFYSEAAAWVKKDFPAVSVAAYVTEDSGRVRWADLDLPFTHYSPQAQRMARIALEDSRRQTHLTASFGLRAYELEAGDIVALNLPRYGYDGTQTFVVLDYELSLENGIELQVHLQLKEWDANIYAWTAAENEQTTHEPNYPTLPNPYAIDAPTGLTLESGTSHLYIQTDGTIVTRIFAQWSLPDDALLASGGRVEIQWKPSASGSWVSYQRLLPNSESAYIVDVQDGEEYDVRVRAVNVIGAESAWTTATNHNVVGKTAAPSDVTGFTATIDAARIITFSWDAVPDLDISYYEIRTGTNWFTGDFAQNTDRVTCTYGPVTYGTYAFIIKAVDTTGNQSVTGATVSVNAEFPPDITGLTYSVNANGYFLSWDASPIPDLLTYEIRRGVSWDGGVPIGFTTSPTFRIDQPYGTDTFWVKTQDRTGDYSFNPASISITFATVPSPSTQSYRVDFAGAWLTWVNPSYEFFSHCEVRRGTSWSSATPIGTTKGTDFNVGFLAVGTTSYLIRTVNTWGALSDPVQVDVVIVSIDQPTFTASIISADIAFTWTVPGAQFGIKEFEIRYGATFAGGTSLGKFSATSHRVKVDWLGARTYWIVAYDYAGNTSSPTSLSQSIAAPGVVSSLAISVINERVLIDWDTPATGTLPIDRYRVYKGATFAGAALIYTVDGSFATFFEAESGSYTYWVQAVDVAGNVGTESGVSTNVYKPTDFIIRDDQTLAGGSATLTRVYNDAGTLIGPVDTSLDWVTSFGSNTNLADEITAGMAVYLEPSTTSDGTIVWTVDYGATLSGSLITFSYVGTTLNGTPTITPNIQTSLDGSSYTNQGDLSEVFVSSFRYAKLKLTLHAPNTHSMCKIENARARITLKKGTDSGVASALAADSGGTTVTFNVDFLDVDSIQLTALSTSFANAVYDFTDVPNPTSFKILVFDKDGNRINGTISWAVEGALNVL